MSNLIQLNDNLRTLINPEIIDSLHCNCLLEPPVHCTVASVIHITLQGGSNLTLYYNRPESFDDLQKSLEDNQLMWADRQRILDNIK